MNINVIPTMKVTCSCGEQWFIALPPWEAAWSTWTEGGYSNCPKCKSIPKSFKWGGMQPLNGGNIK